MNELISTNLGPMTPAQIGDELTYRNYSYQRRNYGLSAERLAAFFGDEPGRLMEERYRKEEEGFKRSHPLARQDAMVEAAYEQMKKTEQ